MTCQRTGSRALLCVLTTALLAACGAAKPPVQPSAGTAASELKLPPGFAAQVVFEGTGQARELYIREDGDLFVSLAGLRDGDHILGLRDEDGDFVIDTVESFLRIATPTDRREPQVHIEYFGEHLYAVDNTRLVRMHLPAGRLTPVGATEIIVGEIPYQRSHRGRTLSIDTDGWVYVNIGAPSNACQAEPRTRGSPGLDPCPQREQHAGIWRWRGDRPNQSRDDGERYAGGIRNAIAQTWDPVYDGLYVGQMGRDQLGTLWPGYFDSRQSAELPAEEFFRVEAGQDFGWPYCYYDHLQQKKVLAPEYGGDGRKIGRCADYAEPLLTFPAHYSPASIAFYHAGQFPPRYSGGAFVALKGSWNRAPLPQEGFLVAFVPFAGGAPTGSWEIFADGFKGFATLYERGNARYRPQSVAVHPDGSLYILDNNEGRIWRVTYTGDLGAVADPTLGQPANDRGLMIAASRGRGAEVYLSFCASCHQPGGGGVPGEFPPLAASAWVTGDTGRLIRTVIHGMQGPIEIAGRRYDELMPGHAFLPDEDIALLLTFIRSAFGNAAEPVHAAEVALVRSAEARTAPWDAAELERRTGLLPATR